jgi:hypothetical protein
MSRPVVSHGVPAGWEVLPWVEKNLLRAAEMFGAQEAAQLRECAARLHGLWREFDGRVPWVVGSVSGRLAAFRLHTEELPLTFIEELPGALAVPPKTKGGAA